MRFAEPARDAATPWAEIARPTRPSRLAGVTMAGFRGRGADVVDYLAVPPPAVMLAVEFGDGRLVVEDATGRERHGSLAAGLAPGAARVRARGGVGCVQVRLAPAAALAVLGVPLVELSHTVVTLEGPVGPRRRPDRGAAAPGPVVGAPVRDHRRRARPATRCRAAGRGGGRRRLGADRHQLGSDPGRPAGR